MKNFKLLIIIFNFSLLIFNFLPSEADAALLINRPLYIGLTSGLVGYWSFDGPDMVATSTGSAAMDRSGQNNTGYLLNGPTRAAGRIGQALKFDGCSGCGQDDEVKVAAAASINNLGALTASAWIKPGSMGETQGRVLDKSDAASGPVNGWIINLDTTVTQGIGFAADFNGGQLLNRITAANAIRFDQWQHVVVTWDGTGNASNIHIYIDGVEQSYSTTQNGTGGRDSDSTEDLHIGNKESNIRTFDGSIDDVRIYNRVLSADEIKRLYKIGATMKINKPQYSGLDSGLVGYWSFDGPDMVATRALDSSGNANHGTLTNGPVRTAGRIGQALDFDGTNDYVNISTAYSLGTQASYSFWINPGGAGYRAVLGKNVNDVGVFVLPTNQISFADGIAHPEFNSIGVVANGQWSHVVVTIDGTSAKIYINGNLDNSGTQYIFNLKLIGIDYATSVDEFFNGLIDEVRVYNRALSADEIKRLYKIGATLKVNKPSYTGLDSGLVGYWSFDGPDMVATSTGSAAMDRSGNNNIGYLMNGPVRAIGKIGQALEFDGVNDVVNTQSPNSLDNIFAGGGAISAWIYPRSSGEGSLGRITDKATSGGVDGHLLFMCNSHASFCPGAANTLDFSRDFSLSASGPTWHIPANSITFNRWYHVVVVYDEDSTNNDPILYLDGVSQTVTEVTAPSGTADSDAANSFLIGNRISGDRTFDGLIDEVRIYNRALTGEEIKRLYNLGR